jgi:hypothetical protein
VGCGAAVFAAWVGSTVVGAQAPAPTQFTVTETVALVGPEVAVTVYRDGNKAAVEQSFKNAGGTTHIKTLYDLAAGTTTNWDPTAAAPSCSAGRFSGDWGDPFASAAEVAGQLSEIHATQVGSESIAGFATKKMEGALPNNQGKVTVWVDAKYGLVMRQVMAGPSGPAMTMVDIKSVTVGAPAASVFAAPASCGGAVKALPMTDDDRIAKETGGKASDFAMATMPPPSTTACSASIRVVRAGTMQTITSGYQIAVDTTVDLNHPAAYTMGVGAAGKATFSGGGLHEITGQLVNGMVKLANVPEHFDVELAFGNAGSASALLYRQCSRPETVLLFVVKNPAKLSDGGDWLWAKTGPYAIIPR